MIHMYKLFTIVLMCVAIYFLFSIDGAVNRLADSIYVFSYPSAASASSYPQNVRNPILDETKRVLQTIK